MADKKVLTVEEIEALRALLANELASGTDPAVQPPTPRVIRYRAIRDGLAAALDTIDVLRGELLLAGAPIVGSPPRDVEKLPDNVMPAGTYGARLGNVTVRPDGTIAVEYILLGEQPAGTLIKRTITQTIKPESSR